MLPLRAVTSPSQPERPRPDAVYAFRLRPLSVIPIHQMMNQALRLHPVQHHPVSTAPSTGSNNTKKLSEIHTI
jgi:hypothetical protein